MTGAAIWVATGVFSVQPNEQAAVQRFGRMLPDLRGPGLHIGLPAGLDRVTRLRVQELRRVAIGAGLGARAAGRDASSAVEFLTGDRNLIGVAGVVQFRVEDVRAFLFTAADVSKLVEDTASAALTTVLAAMPVDEILTSGRLAMQEQIRTDAQAALEARHAGVRIASVTLESVVPPQEAAEAFRDVAAAREDRQRTINEAQGYANRLLPQARGEARQMVLVAQAQAGEMVAVAQGESERFRALVGQIGAARDVTILRLVLEAAEEIMPRLRKVVVDASSRRTLDLGILEAAP
jgi:membrane protease subunit HflK